ncbi:syntaxin-binding protein 5-like [Selaginella moellendorffii]|uniref:syntaxin-binding protein 5-like n=1 Tax=Selaginella moellendorffii TaxID=88036 RepID=UPI000D1C8F47|nr:syntaxin-binding protein 5-like [Selaginella moellendorffii]|eukprot:XP_024529246.1 syntaxin-binding protein 5-like [Selaginella moellendorffii]
MPESQMAVVAVAAVAAIAVGGAAIAFMYHCCQDQVKRQKKEKVERINSQLGIRDEDAHHRYERREEVDVVEIGKAKRPAVRTVEEIKAYYGRPSRKDASSTAGIATEAKNKLMERGEKLQAVNDKTQELESEAESFASLAEELAKKMKARKWWEL